MHEAIEINLSKAWSVLIKESTQSVPNFTSFTKSLKELCFLKGAGISFHLSSTIVHVPQYNGTLVKHVPFMS